MTADTETPFDTIETAHEYVRLLLEAVSKTQGTIQDNLGATDPAAPKRREALQLVDYKLRRLTDHLATSGRLLGDLRVLRGLLDGDARDIDEAIEKPAAPTSLVPGNANVKSARLPRATFKTPRYRPQVALPAARAARR